MKIKEILQQIFKGEPPKPIECIEREVTQEEATEIYLQDLARLFEVPADYDRIKKKIEPGWRKFLLKIQKGDTLFLYNTPQEYWNNMSGRKGFLIKRNGKMLEHLLILQN